MNTEGNTAIDEAIDRIVEMQERDPDIYFLDGHSMTGEEAWKRCLYKVSGMLREIKQKHEAKK